MDSAGGIERDCGNLEDPSGVVAASLWDSRGMLGPTLDDAPPPKAIAVSASEGCDAHGRAEWWMRQLRGLHIFVRDAMFEPEPEAATTMPILPALMVARLFDGCSRYFRSKRRGQFTNPFLNPLRVLEDKDLVMERDDGGVGLLWACASGACM